MQVQRFLEEKGISTLGLGKSQMATLALANAETEQERRYISSLLSKGRNTLPKLGTVKQCPSVTRFLNYLCRRVLPQDLLYEYIKIQPYREAVLSYLLAGQAAVAAPATIYINPKTWSVQRLDWPREPLPDAPYVIRMVGLDFSNSRHSTVLFYGHDQVEYFEPNGIAPWTPYVVQVLRNYLPNLIEPLDYCPRRMLQGLTADLLCGSWSTLWAYLRVMCRELDRKELLALLESSDLQQIVYGWTCFLVETLDKTHIRDYVNMADKVRSIVDYMRDKAQYTEIIDLVKNTLYKLELSLEIGDLDAVAIYYEQFQQLGL